MFHFLLNFFLYLFKKNSNNYNSETTRGFHGNRGFEQWTFNEVYNFNEREKIIKLSPNEKKNILLLLEEN